MEVERRMIKASSQTTRKQTPFKTCMEVCHFDRHIHSRFLITCPLVKLGESQKKSSLDKIKISQDYSDR